MTAQFPRITIVTPSYNQGGFLEQTIRSVLDQGYPNLEYIVIDGGSTDQSVDIIKKYADRMAYWVSEKDKGQNDALNKGMDRATGDIYGFINSDDFLYPGSLQCVADAWNKGAKWIVGWVQTLEADGSEWPQLPQAIAQPSDWFVCNPIPQQSCFWAGEITKKIGNFRDDLQYAFDYEYWMRIRFKAEVSPVIVHRCLGSYRMHSASKTVSQWSKFLEDGDAQDVVPGFGRIRDEYLPLLTPGQRRAVLSKRRKKEWRKHYDMAWAALKSSDVPAARKHAWSALSNAKLNLESWRVAFCAARGH